MANRSNRGRDQAAVGSSATKRGDLYGFLSADFIRASGHADRVEQAGHMSAPDRASNFRKPLHRRGRPHMSPGNSSRLS
jgi:hypothetical protein